MGRPLRMFEPEALYFVTNRTMQSRLFLKPSPAVCKTIGGILAFALYRYEIEIYNFVFLGNHFHLIIKAKPNAISPFMQYLSGNLARWIGRIIRWESQFWARRFSAEPILDEEAFEERMRYVFAHGVKEGLVGSHAEWPGLTAWENLPTKETKSYPWPGKYSGLHKRIIISPSPFSPENITEADQRIWCQKLMRDAECRARENRAHAPCLGTAHISKENPHARPKTTKVSPRTLCHTTCILLRKAFISAYKNFIQAYKEASAAFREGKADVIFPENAYPPPLPYSWQPMHG